MAISREPGLNSGLPEQDGLDEGTKAALLAAANKSGKGVIVGGIQDVQRYFGELAKDPEVPEIGLPPGEDESSPTSLEHDALTNPDAQAGAPQFDDSYTVEELQDALRERGDTVTGTKQELIDRLNG